VNLLSPRRFRAASLVAASVTAMLLVLTAGAAVQNSFFERTWMRTDKPIVDGQVNRTWMWGPIEPAYETTEPYVEAPGGERQVAYFDKSRMEITDPEKDQSSVWYVTNGLLSTELITGQMQVGDAEFETREPAEVNVAGDATDPHGPTYATFGTVLDAPPAEEGTTLIQRIDREGNVSDDPELAGREVLAGPVDDVTNHAIAQPFWDFMTSSGTVWQDDMFITDSLFENPFFATGRPITEAYWATVEVAEVPMDVLIQCFERRCLTYTPENAEGWQVEAGNVGRHYYVWRYGEEPPTGNGDENPIVGDPARGQVVFEASCAHCHSVDGDTSKSGPPVNGLLGKFRTFTNGSSLVADEAYIRESIVDPKALQVAGTPFAMPVIGSLSDQDVEDLVAYIASLD
jgi:cytochrome c2